MLLGMIHDTLVGVEEDKDSKKTKGMRREGGGWDLDERMRQGDEKMSRVETRE